MSSEKSTKIPYKPRYVGKSFQPIAVCDVLSTIELKKTKKWNKCKLRTFFYSQRLNLAPGIGESPSTEGGCVFLTKCVPWVTTPPLHERRIMSIADGQNAFYATVYLLLLNVWLAAYMRHVTYKPHKKKCLCSSENINYDYLSIARIKNHCDTLTLFDTTCTRVTCLCYVALSLTNEKLVRLLTCLNSTADDFLSLIYFFFCQSYLFYFTNQYHRGRIFLYRMSQYYDI